MIKLKTDSYIDASEKSEDCLKLSPNQMKSKKQRVRKQRKNDEKNNDDVVQRGYKRTGNNKKGKEK